MPLEPGSSLGAYSVIAKIGEGGMGEVYQARDTKLDRDVALKVLPEAFTADPDRLARFGREAKILASLNHPNIGTIYGLEEAEGVKALVLELIEGPTLADRIKQGPIPVDEALPIAKQIAEALEAAHEAGVIHRDLKPANIKVREDGTVKVLDFGLAKALDTQPAGDPDQSPTLTAAATQMGVIMGTAAYMSPEQAKGHVADQRADIWAFGVVLLEMLTGQQLFAGPTVAESLAKVLECGPDLRALPTNTPKPIRQLLRRCLQKNRRERLQHAGDVRMELTDAEAAPDTDAEPGPDVRPPDPMRPWLIAVMVGMAALAAFSVGRWSGDSAPGPAQLRRFELPVELVVENENAGARSFALSPAGDMVVYAAAASRDEPLYRHDLDEVDAAAIAGTEGGLAPFFSPDGRWIGFYRPGETTLMRVSLSGGVPETLARAGSDFQGGSWGADDTIVFATSSTAGLMKVPASGGDPEQLTTVADGEIGHGSPHHLPGGDRLLLTIRDRDGRLGESSMIAVVSADGGVPIALGIRGESPRYLPVGSAGYLVYGQANGLVAVSFDLESLQVRGAPVSVLSPVHAPDGRAAYAAMAADGTAVFAGPMATGRFQPTWVARDGSASPIREVEGGSYARVRLSKDGRRAAFDSTRSGFDVYDFDTSELVTLGSERDSAIYPVWNPDGSRLAFTSIATGQFQLYAADPDGWDDVVQLLETDDPALPVSWSPDGRNLFFYLNHPETSRDIYVYSFDDARATPLLATPADERSPMVSPDGGWLAYLSNESGTFEVYVRSLTGPEVTRQVSRDGGAEPNWSPGGDELYYRHAGGAMVAVPFQSKPALELGRPQELFSDGRFQREEFMNAFYDVGLDGRFLMLAEIEAATSARLQVVLGFADEVERLVAAQQE